MKKTETITIDVHLTKIGNIVDLLEEVNVGHLEDVVVYYTPKNLPKDYDIVCCMLMENIVLPSFDEMKSILLSEKITIGLVSADRNSEAFTVYSHCNSRVSSRNGSNNYASFTGYLGNNIRRGRFPTRHYHCGFTSGALNCSKQLQPSECSSYQPRFKPCGTLQPRRNIVCNFCMQLDRECEIKALVDQLRDMEHRLDEK